MFSRGDVLAAVALVSEVESIVPPKVRITRLQGHARFYSWHISVPQWALQKHEAYAFYYICHEIAHLVNEKSGHDLEFKKTEQKLCALFGVKISGYDSNNHNGAYPRIDQVLFA